jgi:predicted DNA-binding antitoxin AbrB/MazE fold protein
MTKLIEAVDENGTLKPLDEGELAEHQRVRVTIEADGPVLVYI